MTSYADHVPRAKVSGSTRRREELIQRIMRRQPGASLPALHAPITEDLEDDGPVARTVEKKRPVNRVLSSVKILKGKTPGSKVHHLEPLDGRVTPLPEEAYGSEGPTDRASNNFRQYDMSSRKQSHSQAAASMIAGSSAIKRDIAQDPYGVEPGKRGMQLARHLKSRGELRVSRSKGRELVLRSDAKGSPNSRLEMSTGKQMVLAKHGTHLVSTRLDATRMRGSP